MEIFELLLHWNSGLCMVYGRSISLTPKYFAICVVLRRILHRLLFMQITFFYIFPSQQTGNIPEITIISGISYDSVLKYDNQEEGIAH